MSRRNRRRSLPESLVNSGTASEEEGGTPVPVSVSDSDGLTGRELATEISASSACTQRTRSIGTSCTRLPRPQVIDVAVATDSCYSKTESTHRVTYSNSLPHEIIAPLILLEASGNPNAVAPLEAISELPYSNPASLPSYSSGREPYDQEPPLITKTQKIYKKRAPLVPRYEDSEESVDVRLTKLQFGSVSSRSFGNGSPDNVLTTAQSDPDADDNWTTNKGIQTPLTESDDFSVSDAGGDIGQDLNEGTVFIYMIIPPDGGFGWVIMFLSFLAQLSVDGIIFSVGILLPHIAKELDVSATVVVFVASVQIGFYYTFGAFASVLINRYGFRPVAITGILTSLLSILIASFSLHIVMLIIFYSAIAGCTLSMIWVSSQLIVGYYFERYRPIANGFSCSGAGVGMLVFSFLNDWLVPIIGWRNVLRTQALLVAFLLLVSIGFVEVPPTQVGVYKHDDDSSSDEYYGNFYVQDFLVSNSRMPHTRSVISAYNPNKRQRCANCCSCCRSRRTKSLRSQKDQNILIKPEPIEREDLFYTGPAEYEKVNNKENVQGKEIILVGSDINTKKANYAIQNIHKDEEPVKEKEDSHFYTMRSGRPPNKIKRAFSRLFDFHLLKKFEFRLLVASALLYPMGFNIPFVYSRLRTSIPVEYAALITPAIGLANFIVRIFCGFVAYKRRKWTTIICGGGLIFGGSVVFLSAFWGKGVIWFQILYGLCYGVAPAVFSTLRALIYVKYLGLTKLTNAFGITALAMGLGVFIGTSIGGLLVGTTGEYAPAFVFAGVCIMASGMLKLLLPILKKRRSKG